MNRRLRSAVVPLLIAGSLIAIARRGAANAPAGRYVVGSDMTVTDTMTRLVWQQTPETPRAWAAAVDYCASIALPGTGWRLPKANELMTLLEATKLGTSTDPMLDTVAFAGTPKTALAYWSSTTLGGIDTRAWAVDFQFGKITDVGKLATSVRARCVRSLP